MVFFAWLGKMKKMLVILDLLWARHYCFFSHFKNPESINPKRRNHPGRPK
jgi:hypothetical protein